MQNIEITPRTHARPICKTLTSQQNAEAREESLECRRKQRIEALYGVTCT